MARYGVFTVMQLSCRLTRQPVSVILLDNRRKKEVIMEIMPHLQIRDDLGVHYAILPGDPARSTRAGSPGSIA